MADTVLVGDSDEWAVVTVAALRALPPPTVPPPGPVDGVVGLLLARAAPFDRATQAALRRQQGWGPGAPEPIPDVRSKGRWLATPSLGRLTRGTTAPGSVLAALDLLEHLVPCTSGEAAAALITAGLSDTVLHPGGLLNLARWYGVQTELRLVDRVGGTAVVGPRPAAVSQLVHRVLTAAGRAGYKDLATLSGVTESQRRYLAAALDQDVRVRCSGDLVVQVDDRRSGLARHTVRMLVASPRPLTLAELEEGLHRNWHFRRDRIPERATVTAWIHAQPWLEAAAGGVAIVGSLTPTQRQVAGSAGTSELCALVAGGRTATRAELLAALVGVGFAVETARMTVAVCPVLVRTRPNEYRLRGAD